MSSAINSECRSAFHSPFPPGQLPAQNPATQTAYNKPFTSVDNNSATTSNRTELKPDRTKNRRPNSANTSSVERRHSSRRQRPSSSTLDGRQRDEVPVTSLSPVASTVHQHPSTAVNTTSEHRQLQSNRSGQNSGNQLRLQSTSSRTDRTSPTDASSPARRRADFHHVESAMSTPANTRNFRLNSLHVRYQPIVTAVVSVIAFISPVIMVILPATGALPLPPSTPGAVWCNATCSSTILSMSFRLLIIAVGAWALFVHGRRRWLSDIPRVEDVEVSLSALVLLVSVVFWSFYFVRIVNASTRTAPDYTRSVSFAGSMTDTLVFLHFVAAVVLRLGDVTSVYVIKVVRSRDGRAVTFSSGRISVQRLAGLCLERFHVDTSRDNDIVSSIKAGDDDSDDGAMSVLSASTQRSASDTNIKSTLDRQKRAARRRARLIAAVDEAFNRQRTVTLRDALRDEETARGDEEDQLAAAAEGVCMAVHGYLRTTNQLHLYSRRNILTHLDACLAEHTSTDVFLNRYLTQGSTMKPSAANDAQTWSLVCSVNASSFINDKTSFMLRSASEADNCLVVKVRLLPDYNFNITNR